MSAMVDRVARAIYAASRERYAQTVYPESGLRSGSGTDEQAWEAEHRHIHETFRCHARAAIEAMREPTTEMSRALFYGLGAPGLIGSRKPPDVASLWAKAIDAALQD